MSGRGFVFFTTRWGAHYGGINTFNVDLCRALARQSVPVACVVLTASAAEVTDAGPIRLLSLDSQSDALDVAMGAAAVKLLTDARLRPQWFIGHDSISGRIARATATSSGGLCAVFHHMVPALYKHIEGYSPERVLEKSREQKEILASADIVFAVGPGLLESASDHLRGSSKARPVEIVPGLLVRQQFPAANNYSALVSGRLDDRSAVTKQLDLSVAGFGAAARDPNGPLGQQPHLVVLGGKASKDEQQRLAELAERQAQRRVEVLPLAYELDRGKYFTTLAEQNAVLMLSWHEAFGLVAWEAIGAGVPIVVSEATGVAKLLRRDFSDEATTLAAFVQIRASADAAELRAEDIEGVAAALTSTATSVDGGRDRALRLRERLVLKGYTWDRTAQTVLEACASLAGPAKPVAQAAIVGEWNVDGVNVGCASVVVILDDLPSFRGKVVSTVERWSRLPTVTNADGVALLSRGFLPRDASPEIKRLVLEFIASAPLRAYAVVEKRPADMTTSRLRQVHLTGLLRTRFSKRDQTIGMVIAQRDRQGDVARAILNGWTLSERKGDAPQLVADVMGSGFVTGIADWIASALTDGMAGDTSDLKVIRRKVVHVWNSETKTNYGLDTVFP